jgi:hypothetical protein
MADYLKYWKEESVEEQRLHEDVLSHSGSGHYGRLHVGDTVWIVTLRNNGTEMGLIGRIVIGEVLNHEQALERFHADALYETDYHVIAIPGTEEENREINIIDIAGELRFIAPDDRDRLRISNNRVNGQQLQSIRKLTPESVELLTTKWYGTESERTAELEKQISVGAGFGDPESNKKVERAAVELVTNKYQNDGWIVVSLETEKCGFDLLCQKDGVEKHIEVKGISGNEISFIITANELRKAQSDPYFTIYAVTSALSENPTLHPFTAQQFLEKFSLNEIAYRAAIKNKKTTRRRSRPQQI